MTKIIKLTVALLISLITLIIVALRPRRIAALPLLALVERWRTRNSLLLHELEKLQTIDAQAKNQTSLGRLSGKAEAYSKAADELERWIKLGIASPGL